jgi:tRNA A-37 threonylcarbamoyl transferase component Bud32
VPTPDRETEVILPAATGEAQTQTLPHTPSNVQEEDTVPPELVDHSRYQILKVLGRGGMGTVYKATHRLMKRLVALKVINESLVANTATVERFRREMEASASMRHPNIVTAYDADQVGGLHLLVMEYVEGTDLKKVLDERGPLPLADACAYIRQVACGLQHAMENGLVHRDIKPQNLILTPEGEVKILDFGLASLKEARIETDRTGTTPTASTEDADASHLSHVGIIMGTPDYMAPEQATDAHSADIRADIYSLGCTLYCLLTGQVPFPGGDYLDKITAHAKRTPRPVREIRKDVPKQLATLLTRMMAKDKAARPQTPAEVAEALQVIEKKLVPCPAGIRIAGWIWIFVGALVLCEAGAGVLYYQVSNPIPVLIFPAMVAFVFITKGVGTLLGKNGTPGRDGFGSINLGIALGVAAGLFIYFRGWVLAAIALVFAVLLLIAGVLVLLHRNRYLAWVRGDLTPSKQSGPSATRR